MPHKQFDRSRLQLQPLSQRKHDLTLDSFYEVTSDFPPFDHPHLDTIAHRVAASRRQGAAVILMMGAHVLRSGNSRLLIDLMERGLLTHVGMNGAGPIHDYELALIGATTESVARYIRTGEFGLWEETGRINEAAKSAASEDIGFGEALGRTIEGGRFPQREVSVLAAGYRLGVPVTIHVGIGSDIIHEHPNANGAALGAASYTDFLVLAESVSQLQGGVLLNFGTAVMGPEVYLKALAMARNVASQEGRRIDRFTTAVFDLLPLGDDYASEPPKSDPRYYFRPWKTILARTVGEGGESYYVQGDHRATFPNLWKRLVALSPD